MWSQGNILTVWIRPQLGQIQFESRTQILLVSFPISVFQRKARSSLFKEGLVESLKTLNALFTVTFQKESNYP